MMPAPAPPTTSENQRKSHMERDLEAQTDDDDNCRDSCIGLCAGVTIVAVILGFMVLVAALINYL